MATPTAPTYSVGPPTTHFAAIEYPGPVNSTPRALKTLGGLPHISSVLANPPSPARVIELSLNAKNPFFHPVQANVLETGNIVLKVVRRRRKKPKRGEDGELEVGVFSIEVAGVATRTVRLRGMADFQTSTHLDDPIVDIAKAVREMDVSAIESFRFPEPSEDFSDDLYLPPPVFSRHVIPQPYDYRPVSASAPQLLVRETGEEVLRLVNNSRYKGRAMPMIAFADENPPQGPTDEGAKTDKSGKGENSVEKHLLELLDERPVWTRTAICNKLPLEDARIVINHKQALQNVSYTFKDGPFRDLIIRFGYDPRKDPQARFYQHVTLRNVTNTRAKIAAAPDPKGKSKAKEDTDRLSHAFDGVTVHSKIGNFQLIDITDRLARALIDSSAGVLPACSSGLDGWYDPDYFEQIRQVVRRRFMGIHSGVVVTDEDCEDLLGDPKRVFGGARGKKGSEKGSGSESGSGTGEDKEAKEKRKRRGVKRAPWEPQRKKTKAKAKAKDETEEEKAERLRLAIGLAQGNKRKGTPDSDEDDDDEGSGSDEEEDDE